MCDSCVLVQCLCLGVELWEGSAGNEESTDAAADSVNIRWPWTRQLPRSVSQSVRAACCVNCCSGRVCVTVHWYTCVSCDRLMCLVTDCLCSQQVMFVLAKCMWAGGSHAVISMVCCLYTVSVAAGMSGASDVSLQSSSSCSLSVLMWHSGVCVCVSDSKQCCCYVAFEWETWGLARVADGDEHNTQWLLAAVLGHLAVSVSQWHCVTDAATSHTRTVVRECCKGDDASQWENGKFDPLPRPNPLTDRHKKLHMWLRHGYLPTCKI